MAKRGGGGGDAGVFRRHAGRARLDAAGDDAGGGDPVVGEAAASDAGPDVEAGADIAADAGSGGTFSQLDPSERRQQSASDTSARGAEVRGIGAPSYHQSGRARERRLRASLPARDRASERRSRIENLTE